jgi:hypothetical protein
MTELENFIATKGQNTKQTIKNYRSQYKSIIGFLEKDMTKASEEEIIEAVELLANGNHSNEWTYMNLPFMIRELYKQPTDLIQKRREQLKILRDVHLSEMKEMQKGTLPSMKIIQDFTKQLYKNKDYKRFIVNFLIINYGVRNKDINVYITGSPKNANDTSKNYLIVKASQIEWRINEYKTVQTHGSKKIIIKSKPFLEAVKTLPLNTWLLSGKETPLAESSLGSTIRKLLFNLLTESDYFKIIMENINTKPNTTELLEYYSRTRGTKYETLLGFYDLSKRGEILPDDSGM